MPIPAATTKAPGSAPAGFRDLDGSPGAGPARHRASAWSMRRIARAAALLLSLLALGDFARPTEGRGQVGASETAALDRVLFPPELIMQHRRAIGLTDEQRDAMSRMIQELQGRVVGLQWELQDDVQLLTEVLESPRVDLDLALDRLDAVLETEKRIKEAHLELLVRIKNVLEPAQQATLQRLRGREGGG